MSHEFILETRDLTREFKGFIAVDRVNLQVRRGSIHALIGPNGAGKTTMFNLLTKFLPVTSGQILYRGQDITALPAAKVARMGMVRSFQISAVFPHLTVLENVRIGLQRKLGTSFHFWKPESSLYSLNNEAMALLEQVDLADFAQTQTVELPYGRKRALEIATTLALDPTMLLLDEPTSGMGREDIGVVAALIKRVATSRTILMVEHNLGFVSDLADTITVLARGEVLAEGTYQQVSSNKEVMAAYIGKPE